MATHPWRQLKDERTKLEKERSLYYGLDECEGCKNGQAYIFTLKAKGKERVEWATIERSIKKNLCDYHAALFFYGSEIWDIERLDSPP